MNENYIKIGTIIKTRGYKGELVLFDVPKALTNIREGATAKVGYSLSFSEDYTVTKYDTYQKGGVIRFEGINDEIEGKELKERGVFINKDDIIRKEKEYIEHELAGCKVYNNETDEYLGEIIDVMELPANDVWIMKTENAEVPLPVIDEVVKSVDIDTKTIKITIIDGLMELGEQKSE